MITFTSPLEMGGNKIKNMKFEEHTSDPTTDNFEGRLYTNSSGVLRRYTNGEWAVAENDNVIFVDDFNALPTVGELDKLYSTKDTKIQYEWDMGSYNSVIIPTSSPLPYKGYNVAYDGSGIYKIYQHTTNLGGGVVGEMRSLVIRGVAPWGFDWWNGNNSATNTHPALWVSVAPNAINKLTPNLHAQFSYAAHQRRHSVSLRHSSYPSNAFWRGFEVTMRDQDTGEVFDIAPPTNSNNTNSGGFLLHNNNNYEYDLQNARVYVKNVCGEARTLAGANGRPPGTLACINYRSARKTAECTISVPGGGKLDGVTNGKVRIKGIAVVNVVCVAPNQWVTDVQPQSRQKPNLNLSRSSKDTTLRSKEKLQVPSSGVLNVSYMPETHLTEDITAVTTHTFIHGFGRHPIVTVTDASGVVIQPDTITNTNTSTTVVTFTTATTGSITYK